MFVFGYFSLLDLKYSEFDQLSHNHKGGGNKFQFQVNAKMWIFLLNMIIMHDDEQAGDDSDEQ